MGPLVVGRRGTGVWEVSEGVEELEAVPVSGAVPDSKEEEEEILVAASSVPDAVGEMVVAAGLSKSMSMVMIHDLSP